MTDAPNFQRYALKDPTVEALQYDERFPEAGIDGWLFGSQLIKLGDPLPRAMGRKPAILAPTGHTVIVKDGDWIIKSASTGRKFVVSRHDFDGIYERMNDVEPR